MLDVEATESVAGLGTLFLVLIIENQLENNMDNEMEYARHRDSLAQIGRDKDITPTMENHMERRWKRRWKLPFRLWIVPQQH